MEKQSLRSAVLEVEEILTGRVDSPLGDAELLAAYVVGVPRAQLPMDTLVDSSQVQNLRMLAARRALHVPVQRLTGTAVLGGIEVAVGPGVFLPYQWTTGRLLDWGLAAMKDVEAPLVVDLCTGSGAVALAVAHARPDAQVHAVELDPTAFSWARSNADARSAAGDTPIQLHSGDVSDPGLLAELDGMVHLVLSNPPYTPLGATWLPPEFAHDPPVAVWGGEDGLEVIRHVVRAGTRLLREGGSIGIEHDESHEEAVSALLEGSGAFTDVADHNAQGVPRFATARCVAYRSPQRRDQTGLPERTHSHVGRTVTC